MALCATVWDSGNRLTTVASNGAQIVAYAYDCLGRRVKKTTSTAATYFFYDGWNLVREIAVRGAETNVIEYVWGKDLSGSFQGAGGVGGLLYEKRNGAIYIPYQDAFGNIMGYWDTNGVIVAEYTYDAFGRTIAQSGSMADVFRHRFSTKYYDEETGFYYYGYRHYFPELRRWLSRDPIEEDGSVNLTSFLDNNPVANIDPLGNLVIIVLAGVEQAQKPEDSAFLQTKNYLTQALRKNQEIMRRLEKLPEATYNCLRDKELIFFDGQRFKGSLDAFKKQVNREFNSVLRIEANYTQSLNALANYSMYATEPHDYVVYAAHGEPAWGDDPSNKNMTDIFYQDGLKTQRNALMQARNSMRNQVGTKLIVSCYQTWDGIGQRPSDKAEKLRITPPSLTTTGEISYVPLKARRTIGE